MKKIFFRILAMAMTVAMLVCAMTSCRLFTDNYGDFTLFENIIAFFESPVGAIGRSKIVMRTENCTVDANMMSYFVGCCYQRFVADYSSYFGTTISFEEGQSPKEQLFDRSGKYYDREFFGDIEGETWWDYFLETTEDEVSQMLIYAEYANENGVDYLDEEDYDSIAEVGQLLERNAEMYGYDVNEYIEETYGKGVSAKDIENCIILRIFAMKGMGLYYEDLRESIKTSDVKINEEYNSNRDAYDAVTYLEYKIELERDDYDSDDEYEEMIKKVQAGIRFVETAVNPGDFRSQADNAEYQLFGRWDAVIEQKTVSVEKTFDSFASDDAKMYDVMTYYMYDAMSEPEEDYGKAEIGVRMLIEPRHRDERTTLNLASLAFDSYDDAMHAIEELIAGKDGGYDETLERFGNRENVTLDHFYNYDPEQDYIGEFRQYVQKDNYSVEELDNCPINEWLIESEEEVSPECFERVDGKYVVIVRQGAGETYWLNKIVDNLLAKEDFEYNEMKLRGNYSFELHRAEYDFVRFGGESFEIWDLINF